MPTVPYVKQTWTDGSSLASAARLGVIESGIFEVSYAPAVRVFHNANQNVTTATATALAFNSERFDQAANAADTMHDTVTNNSRLTCRYAGIYYIFGNIVWDSSTAGTYRQVGIRHSLTGNYVALQMSHPPNNVLAQNVSSLFALAVNEYVELVVQQDSGGTRQVTAANNYGMEFGMVRVA